MDCPTTPFQKQANPYTKNASPYSRYEMCLLLAENYDFLTLETGEKIHL